MVRPARMGALIVPRTLARKDDGGGGIHRQGAAITVRELMTRLALCVFPVGHTFAARREITAADQADIPFVSFPSGTPARFDPDRQMLTEATTHEADCNLVGAGLGVSIVSPYSRICGAIRRWRSDPSCLPSRLPLACLPMMTAFQSQRRPFIDTWAPCEIRAKLATLIYDR